MSAGRERRGAVGQRVSRVDGLLKAAGQATFTAEYKIDDVAHAALVLASIVKGRLARIDTSAARREPGVIAVLTHENAPPMHAVETFGPDSTEPAAAASSIPPLGTEIFYYGQPIAVVVAATVEQAEHAATLVMVEYDPVEAKTSFETGKRTAVEPENILGEPTRIVNGDADAALAAAPRKVDHVYRTPPFNHNAIELHATIAQWSADERRLTVYDATQYVAGTQHMLAKQFGLNRENVRVIAQFVGGGFGGKGTAWPHVALAAASAKVARRPVKLSLSRAGVHYTVGGRTPTEQRMALGATDTGKLTALIQTGTTWASRRNDFAEPFTFPARHLYACDNIRLGQTLVYLDIVPNTFMRAPGESVGTFALESAIDELAHELGMDPIALRIQNEPDRDPTSGLPFSTRHLADAYRLGAEQFGWARRRPAPRTTRDGRALVGYGVATAYYPANQFPSAARVTMRADGSATGQSSTHEMGMGTATVQAQHLADQLGLPLNRVRFEYGDSRLPEGPIAGGSSSTISVGAAITVACDAVKRRIHELVRDDERSALVGTRLDEVEWRDGGVYRRDLPGSGETFTAILQRLAMSSVEADGQASRDEEAPTHSFGSYGAQFIEVRVDEETGEVHVTRALGGFRLRTNPQPQDSEQPMARRHRDGYWHGAQRGGALRPALGPHRQPLPRGVSCSREPRCSRHRGPLSRHPRSADADGRARHR
jgi:xanthine dehydrogenase YagR molybdenum-binding subunit